MSTLVSFSEIEDCCMMISFSIVCDNCLKTAPAGHDEETARQLAEFYYYSRMDGVWLCPSCTKEGK